MLIGFPSKDAEVRTRKNNEPPYAILSPATKQSWRDRESGERMSETTWHRCVVWGRLGEYAATFTKGAHVQIESDIRKRDYKEKVAARNPPR